VEALVKIFVNRNMARTLILIFACSVPADGLILSRSRAEQTSTRKVIRSARSGAWSEAATWEAATPPAAGDSVLVRAGHTVVYDVQSDRAVRVLQVAGTLRFVTDRDTRLDVGLLRIQAGDEVSESGLDCDAHMARAEPAKAHPGLEVGSPGHPVAPGHRALIRLIHFAGMNEQFCPAIVCCGGRMDLHGAPMARTWLKLGAPAREDDREITLQENAEGWRPGDKIVVTSTARLYLFDESNKVIPTVRGRTRTEERTITAVAGAKITLDRPLENNHRCEGDYRGEVANLSRNVIVESANPDGVRGHTMYHAGSAGAISYAEFRHLGKKDVLGRYSLHYHLCRDSMRGSYVLGASIHDSQNRWLTVHGTDYLIVRDTVGYNSLGHGFLLEDGTEVFNVFDRNLAIQACHAKPLPEQILPFDDNAGAGFWWANCLNTFTRNVAVECDQYAYRFEMVKTKTFDPVLKVPQPDGSRKAIDVRTLPFVRFDNNEAHTQRRFALNLGGIRHVSSEEDHREVHKKEGGDLSKIQGGHPDGVGPDTRHPFIIRDYRVWSSQWAFHGGSPNVRIEGLDAYECTYGIFKTRMDGHEYRGLKMRKIDTPEIFHPWGSTTVGENYWRFLDPVDDLPPMTIITGISRTPDGKLLVRGTTSDNGPIKRVMVCGREARSLRDYFAEWEVVRDTLPADSLVTAFAEDAAGNVEPRPHRLKVGPMSTLDTRAVTIPASPTRADGHP
jgi:hypothetical protein